MPELKRWYALSDGANFPFILCRKTREDAIQGVTGILHEPFKVYSEEEWIKEGREPFKI